jgi:diacylglycerol kinase (ATP)
VSTDDDRPVGLLVNPTAGKGKGGRVAPAVESALTAAGRSVRRIVGRDAGEALDLAHAAVAHGLSALVAVGGDGMVNLALQSVGGTPTPLAIVPAGTGNDIARSLGVPLDDPAAAGRAVVDVPAREIDLGRVGSRWFGGVLGSGFDSMVNERANRMSWPTGRARYNLAILAELRVFRPVPFVLELDGERWETEAMLVAVGNAQSYGGGMRVTPGAVMDDGLLDVMVLGPISKPEFLKVFPTVYKGTHVEHPAVTIRRARVVSLAAAGVVAYADGERLEPLPITVEAVPRALCVHAPPVSSGA